MKISLLFLAFSLNVLQAAAKGIKPVYLRCEYKVDPVTDVSSPRLSWELTAIEHNQLQTAYQVLVASSADKLDEKEADLWNPGKIAGRTSSQIAYAGKPLSSRQICYWKVKSCDKNGIAGQWSQVAKWEMGLLEKTQWKASWIGYDLDRLGKGKVYHLPPAPYLRKEIIIKKAVKKARLYVTALGLYQINVNGKKAGDAYLTPGWTDYDKRVYYQVYDVSSDLKLGANALSSQLSYGWYAGYLGYALLVGNPVVRGFYGKVPLLKAQLEVTYQDGSHQAFLSDESWKVSKGALTESDLLNGETYDGRLELSGWKQAGYDDQSWKTAQVFEDKAGRMMQVYPGPPVRITQTLAVKSITERPDGTSIFDMGQNFAGIVRLKVKGRAGDTIRLRFGEKLYPDGRLMTENLRMARASDFYILKGLPAAETWEPQFTFHGFQYVEVKGLREKPTAQTITGLVIGSDTPKTGSFQTDNAVINQLYSNIDWTQRANYIDIPTDCPQRDERIGWTGDAQVYVKSATFNRDVASFFTKWIVDLNDGQYENGAFPLYAPRPNLRKSDTFSPGWMEAGIICPYQIYRAYGDTRIISEGWPNMVRFMDFLQKRSKGTFVFKENAFDDIEPKGGYGDWLSFGKKTPPDLLASFYYAYCADLMSEMATAIGNHQDQARFSSQAALIRKAVLEHYTDSDGKFKVNAKAYGSGQGYVDGELGFTGHTQTAYANAIYMNIIDKKERDKAGTYLLALLNENGGKLGTGFLGAKPLLPALSATGHSEDAYRLFLSKEFPSWGFEVTNGSTTIWERWDSFTKEDGFKYNAAMNSFSHYAFGAVCEWMFGNAAGIKATKAGFETFDIRPEIAPDNMGKDGISHLTASLRTMNGEIVSEWKKDAAHLKMTVKVPVNTIAHIYVPAGTVDQIKLNGQRVVSSKEGKLVGQEQGYVIVEVGSGIYKFEVTTIK